MTKDRHYTFVTPISILVAAKNEWEAQKLAYEQIADLQTAFDALAVPALLPDPEDPEDKDIIDLLLVDGEEPSKELVS